MLAETCASLLQTAHPLHTIFGPYYQPEQLAGQCYRSPSTSPIQANVPYSPVAIRMERRRYVSDQGLRTELVKLYNVRSAFPAASYKTSTPNCVDFAQTTLPGQQIREIRQRTITKVASAIQGHFGHEYRVEVFGSTQYGVDGQTSDVDMVVVVGILLMPHLRGSEICYRTPTEWQDSPIMSISVHYLVRFYQSSFYKYFPY